MTSPSLNPVSGTLGRIPRRFDGIICFGGEDWWYHNQGHHDMQMMRRLSRSVPVLYVNSLGMRFPRITEGRRFFARLRRKSESIRRGLTRATSRLSVLSPLTLPGVLGVRLCAPRLARSVSTAAQSLGIERPLVWIACVPAAGVLDRIDHVGVVYQRTDRYEDFRGVSRGRIASHDRALKARADVTTFCAHGLLKAEASQCRRALLVDHGVDYGVFHAGPGRKEEWPPEIANLPRPLVGFIGGIDAHTFDPALFGCVARAMPDVHFVLVGDASIDGSWRRAPNVTHISRRPHAQIPLYMGACDALIMPWRRSPWISACNPIKLKEYLATGRPVVSTFFPELRRYAGLVRTAGDAAAFVDELRGALREVPAAEAVHARIAHVTWERQSEFVLRYLAAVGLEPEPALRVTEQPILRLAA